MNIRTLSNLDDFINHWRRLHSVMLDHNRIEESLCAPYRSRRAPFVVPGFSYTAGQTVDLSVTWAESGSTPNWRESLVCPLTKLNARLRAAVQIIDSHLGLYPDSTIYITEQTTPLFTYLRAKYPTILGSEYRGDRLPLGTVDAQGTRNEDMTCLSFPDGIFDAVLSFECLEHIPKYQQALREIVRVLRPSGYFFFSVPFLPGQSQSVTRAHLRQDGSIDHILEPEYHGDPMQAQGCLCFTHFGWSLLSELRNAGFSEAKAMVLWSREFGYLGDELLFILARKT